MTISTGAAAPTSPSRQAASIGVQTAGGAPASGNRPLRPADDPFYLPPAGYETTAPGTILRERTVRVGIASRLPQRVTARQLLYRTAGVHGEPQATVTTVLVPRSGVVSRAPKTAPTRVLSFQCAINAINSETFPSYVLQAGAHVRGMSIPQLEYLIITSALARGWVVSVPDHEGPSGNWIAPREPGYCALDGVRATLSLPGLGLAADTPIGLLGYSGGGLATSWAAELADEYAPELNVVGAALGSPVGDPGNTFLYLNKTLFTGLPTMVIAALARVYPDIADILRTHVTDKGQAMFFEQAPSWTTEDAIRAMAKKDFARLATIPLDDIVAMPKLQAIFEQIRPGARPPGMPVLVVQAENDKIIDPNDIDGQVRRYVEAGAHVEYVRDQTSGHFSLHLLAAPMMLDFIGQRFAGAPLGTPGTRSVRSVMGSRASIVGMGRLLAAAGRAAVLRRP